VNKAFNISDVYSVTIQFYKGRLKRFLVNMSLMSRNRIAETRSSALPRPPWVDFNPDDPSDLENPETVKSMKTTLILWAEDPLHLSGLMRRMR
jgi:hypothetical protein